MIQIEGVKLSIIRKRVKNINLRLHCAEREIKISAPLFVSDDQIIAFLNTKKPWIKRHFDTATSRPQSINAPSLVQGSLLSYLGKKYQLVVRQKSKTRKQCVELEHNVAINLCAYQLSKPDENQPLIKPYINNRVWLDCRVLYLYVKDMANITDKQKALDNWYRQRLLAHIHEIVSHYEPVINVEVKQFKIKKMRTRWGSCNIHAQRIWLNFELIKRPQKHIEYVVVHEMVHLLEASHNQRFKNLMSQFFPQWRSCQQALNSELY